MSDFTGKPWAAKVFSAGLVTSAYDDNIINQFIWSTCFRDQRKYILRCQDGYSQRRCAAIHVLGHCVAKSLCGPQDEKCFCAGLLDFQVRRI